MESINGEVATRIKALLEEKRLSRNALAAGAGLAYNTLNRKLNGGPGLTLDELGRIATQLGVTPKELMPTWFVGSKADNAA